MKKDLVGKLPSIVIATVFAAFLVVALWTSYLVFALNDTTIYKENGLLENIQATTLSIACLTFLASAAQRGRRGKLVLVFFAWTCYAAVLREVDVEKIALMPDILKFIWSGVGRNITVGAGFVAISVYALRKIAYYKEASREYLKSKAGKLLVMSLAFAIIGQVSEKFDTLAHHVYFEEIFEFLAFVCVLSAAAVTFTHHLCNPPSCKTKDTHLPWSP